MDIEIQPLLDDFEETGHKTVLNPPEAQTSFHVIHEELDDAVQVHSADQETTDEYDIFISHASEDLEDVKPLCNELENRYRFKCMLADRDFDIGVPVENNLKLKMEQSKKILLIISPGFVESFWCKSEMMRAFMMMSSGKKDLIIPVLLKPVMTEMPPFLEYYTYIDASKTDDLSYKIFETFHNPKIIDRTDRIRNRVFPYTQEELKNQNGARLLTNQCRKAQRSCRGVAWTFPPLDESQYESEVVLQIYDEVADIMNKSSLFNWYGLMFNTRRQVILSIVTFVLILIYPPAYFAVDKLNTGKDDDNQAVWFLSFLLAMPATVIVPIVLNVKGKKKLTALERIIFDYCLKRRKDSAILALVIDNYKHARILARPTSLVLIRYNLEQCENFVFESLKVDEQPEKPLDKEAVVKQVHDFIFNNRQTFIDWNEKMPVTEINRHNTWMQKQCVCKFFLSVHKQKKRGMKSE